MIRRPSLLPYLLMAIFLLFCLTRTAVRNQLAHMFSHGLARDAAQYRSIRAYRLENNQRMAVEVPMGHDR